MENLLFFSRWRTSMCERTKGNDFPGPGLCWRGISVPVPVSFARRRCLFQERIFHRFLYAAAPMLTGGLPLHIAHTGHEDTCEKSSWVFHPFRAKMLNRNIIARYGSCAVRRVQCFSGFFSMFRWRRQRGTILCSEKRGIGGLKGEEEETKHIWLVAGRIGMENVVSVWISCVIPPAKGSLY